MIGLLQRVQHASVTVDDKEIAHIEQGLLVLIGVERNDSTAQADRLLTRLLGYRVFSDDHDKMNLSVQDINGGLLLVPQFTYRQTPKKACGQALLRRQIQRRVENYLTILSARLTNSMLMSLAVNLVPICKSLSLMMAR